MDFFNNKNLKKIFYLLAIISLLLSIKTRCFGSVNFTGIDNKTYILPDEFFDYKYIIVYSYTWHIEVVASDTKPYAHIRKNANNQVTGIVVGFKSADVPFIRVTAGNYTTTDFSGKTIESSTTTANDYLANEDIYYIYGVSGGGIYMIQGSNYDVPDSITGETIFTATEQPNVVEPFISNTTQELTDLTFNNLYVEIGDYDISQAPLYLHVLQINNTVTENDEILYYYGDHVIKLSQNDKYYKQLLDTSSYYFSIPKSKLNLDVDSSYLLVLDNSSKLYENSQGLIEKNVEQNIYDVQEVDTAGILTQSEVDHNNFLNMQESLQNIQNSVDDTNVQNTTQNQIDTSLNYSSDNEQLSNVFSGFFSRLSSWLNQFLDYDITQDTTLNIPVPYSDKSITLHSNTLYEQLHNTALYPIIYTFYMFIFMTNLVLFYTKIYARLVTGGYLNSLKNPISETGIDKTLL